jgi:hypothetical protein
MHLTRYLFAALLPLAACSEPKPDVLAMKIELKALKHELEYLRHETEDLEPRVRVAEQAALQVMDERAAPFRLGCLDRAPGIVVTRVATLTARCDEAYRTPVGYSLKLMLGNPTTAWLNGMRITLYAGSGARAGRSEWRTYHELATSPPPGGSKSVILEVAGLDDAALSELALRVRINEIELAQR